VMRASSVDSQGIGHQVWCGIIADYSFTHNTTECPDNGGAGPSKRTKSISKSTKSSTNTSTRGRGGKRGGKRGPVKTKGGTFGAPDDV